MMMSAIPNATPAEAMRTTGLAQDSPPLPPLIRFASLRVILIYAKGTKYLLLQHE